ncbi:hypothetical protein FB107DRAFT_265564 [Schizophyllum commune]
MSFGGFGSTLKPAASTPSLFGNTAQNNQQKPAGGLFGAPAGGTFGGSSTFGQPQQQQGNTGGGLFGNTNTNTSTTNTGTGGGGLFGNTGGNQQQGSSLFGQSNQQQQQPATGGGLFGSTTNTNTGTGGGLFGSTNNTTTGTGGGGLFGNTSNANTSNTGTGGGLFGSTSNTNTGGGGLFGSTSNTNTNTGGLFGSNNANAGNANTGGGGLFGSTNTNTNTGGGLFGNTQNQQQNQGGSTINNNSLFGAKPSTGAQQPMSSLGSQQQGAPPFTKSTRFNDLPDNLKRVFEQIDSHIQGQVQISKDLQQRKMGEEAVKGQQAIRSVHKDLVNAMATINRDLQQAKDLWHKSEQATQDLITGMNIVNGAKNPQAYGAHLKDFAGFPLDLFRFVRRWRLFSWEMWRDRGGGRLITTSLQAQNSAFLALAAKTATLDAELKKIKDLYRKLWREKNASLRDPFNELDRDEKQQPGSQDFGMSQMRVG